MLRRLKKIIITCGFILFLSLLLLPEPQGLVVAAKNSIALFILCLSLWVSNVIPLAITSLLGIVLIPLLGILEVDEAFALFGNKAIFFILGALILATGIYQTGLGSRIAFNILKRFGHGPRQLLLGILLTSALLSCIMPEHAVAALLLPIILEIATSLDLRPLQSNYGKLLFLSMSWGAIIGGITTFLGGARNLLAVGLLERNYGISIGFFEWVKYSWPIPILILIVTYFIIAKLVKIDIDSIEPARERLKRHVEEEGMMSIKEKRLTVVLVMVLCGWLFLSSIVDIAIISVLGAVLTFVIKVVEWSDIEEYINWGVILMYGGAIAVATSLVRSGATTWLSETIFTHLALPPFIFLVFLAIFTMLVTEGISNVAAVAIILPLAYTIGEIYHINPIIITLSVALPGGLAFSLPMGSPPNAIAYSSGYYRISDVVKFGVILMLVSWIAYILVARFYWPLIGLEIVI
jgi:sodium-dependent dicarboxylate transporter 2/3/5